MRLVALFWLLAQIDAFLANMFEAIKVLIVDPSGNDKTGCNTLQRDPKSESWKRLGLL